MGRGKEIKESGTAVWWGEGVVGQGESGWEGIIREELSFLCQ